MKWLHSALHSSFGGITMQQCWGDLVLWEYVLNSQRFASLLELGTYKGGFSLFLWAQCEARDITFWTFDTRDLLEAETVRHRFINCNIFRSDEVEKRMVRPCLLFCDNGHKKSEVRRFVPLLQSGDVLGVHDWNMEIRQEDIPDGLIPLYHDEAQELNMITRFWRVP